MGLLLGWNTCYECLYEIFEITSAVALNLALHYDLRPESSQAHVCMHLLIYAHTDFTQLSFVTV